MVTLFNFLTFGHSGAQDLAFSFASDALSARPGMYSGNSYPAVLHVFYPETYGGMG